MSHRSIRDAASHRRARTAFATLVFALCATDAHAIRRDIEGPAGSGEFGAKVFALANGNFVVTDPDYDGDGLGALHLHSRGGTRISTLVYGSRDDFAFVDIPLERPDRPLFQPNALEPDTVSNIEPFNGRVYVLVLDDLHTAPLRTQLVKNAARQFIQRNLGANDLMAIVTTGGRSDQNQEFTSNRRLLLAPGCSLPTSAPVDLIRAARNAAREAQP